MSVAVAMVEPQYEINVGYVARVMKNFGCNNLYFVSPRFNNIGDALRYSTHGKNILESASEISLGQLREKFDVLVATTALSGTSRLNVNREAIDPARLAEVISITRDKKNFCIILGRESSGLNNDELAICDLVINIDTKTKYKTMNISHALAILLYEISKKTRSELIKTSNRPSELASKKELDLLIEYIKMLSTMAGYDEHKRPLLNSATRRLLSRSSPTSKEVMLLVSLLRKSIVAIERYKPREIR